MLLTMLAVVASASRVFSFAASAACGARNAVAHPSSTKTAKASVAHPSVVVPRNGPHMESALAAAGTGEEAVDISLGRVAA
jgi:hypothetical protein